VTAATLAAAEWILRAWFEEPTGLLLLRGADFHRVYFEADPFIGVVRKRNVDFKFRFLERPSGYVHFRTNNIGLRGSVATALDKVNETPRVIVLGDSQLDGTVADNENMTSILEAELAAKGKQYEILNAATGSYSPYQSYLWFRHYGASLKPDIVIFGIFVGNDFAELLTPGRPRLVSLSGSFKEVPPSKEFLQKMKVAESNSVWSRWNSDLLQRSALYQRLTLLVSQDLPTSEGSVAEAYSSCLGCTAQSLGQIHWFNERGNLDLSLDILREILARLRSDLNGLEAELLILLIPTRTQIEPELDRVRIQSVCHTLKLSPEQLLIEDELCQRVIEIANDLSVSVIDLRTGFRNVHKETGRPMFYSTDWHCNAMAHKTMAAVLSQHMEVTTGF